MTVRRNQILEDTMLVFKAFFDYLVANTAPWTSWSVVKGWPETDILNQFNKAVIYIDSPLITTDKTFMQGGRSNVPISVMVGIWNDVMTGGLAENRIIASYISDIFSDPSTLNAVKFSVTLGTTAYTNKSLLDMKLRVRDVFGPRNIQNPDDEKQFRQELEIITIF